MTLEAEDFDEELEGHSAVVLEAEDEPICHGVVSVYLEEGREDRTECGEKIQGRDIGPREDFIGPEHTMCGECWPESIRTDD